MLDFRESALRILSRANQPKKKLVQKLVLRGASSSDAKAIADEMEKKGFIDENQYVISKARQFSIRGDSLSMIVRKLAQDGLTVTPDEIESILDQEGLNPDQGIEKLLQRKTKNINWETLSKEEAFKVKRKLFSVLSRKGYAPDCAFKKIEGLFHLE